MNYHAQASFLLMTYAKFSTENWPAIARMLEQTEQDSAFTRTSYRHVDGTRLIQLMASDSVERLVAHLADARSRKRDAAVRPYLQVEYRRQILERQPAPGSTAAVLPTAQSLRLYRTELPVAEPLRYGTWSPEALRPALATQSELIVHEFRGFVTTEPGVFHFVETAGGPEQLEQRLESKPVAAAFAELSRLGVAPSAVSQWQRHG